MSNLLTLIQSLVFLSLVSLILTAKKDSNPNPITLTLTPEGAQKESSAAETSSQ